MHKYWTYLFFAVLNFGLSQETPWQKGVILDSIAVANETSETFALYLPQQFDQNKSYPIVFIFDPSGNGKQGILPFTAGAEKYGYILVCSNASRNGPFDQNLRIAENLFEHLFSLFPVNERRIYTAGFSGGSRLASTIAVLGKSIQGVIACGAGFAPNFLYTPTKEDSFSYVGLVGDEDMNYQEMTAVAKRLDSVQISHQIFRYEDGHKWPASKQINRAFHWLELQAYQKTIKAGNRKIIKEGFLKDYRIADSLLQQQKMYSAVDQMEYIITNYSVYFKLDSLHQKVASLKKTKTYKSKLRQQSKIATTEVSIRKQFDTRFWQDMKQLAKNPNYEWWEKAINKLDGNYKNHDQIAYQKMWKRVRYHLFAMAIETSFAQVRNKNFKQALYCDRLLVLQRKNDPYAHYRLAQSYSRLYKLQQTLDHLKIALEGGMEKQRISKASAFDKYRNNSLFIALLENY